MAIIIIIILLFLIILLKYLCATTSIIENLDTSTPDTSTSDTLTSDTSTSDTSTSDTLPQIPQIPQIPIVPPNTIDAQYQHYRDLETNNQNGPMFLALKNAANIATLHTQLGLLSNIKEQVFDISGQVQTNSAALVQIGNHISDLAFSTVGGAPPPGQPLPQLTGLN